MREKKKEELGYKNVESPQYYHALYLSAQKIIYVKAI